MSSGYYNILVHHTERLIGSDTVDKVLLGELNVGERAVAGELDAITQRRCGAKRPAGATVLRDVLVEVAVVEIEYMIDELGLRWRTLWCSRRR